MFCYPKTLRLMPSVHCWDPLSRLCLNTNLSNFSTKERVVRVTPYLRNYFYYCRTLGSQRVSGLVFFGSQLLQLFKFRFRTNTLWGFSHQSGSFLKPWGLCATLPKKFKTIYSFFKVLGLSTVGSTSSIVCLSLLAWHSLSSVVKFYRSSIPFMLSAHKRMWFSSWSIFLTRRPEGHAAKGLFLLSRSILALTQTFPTSPDAFFIARLRTTRYVFGSGSLGDVKFRLFRRFRNRNRILLNRFLLQLVGARRVFEVKRVLLSVSRKSISHTVATKSYFFLRLVYFLRHAASVRFRARFRLTNLIRFGHVFVNGRLTVNPNFTIKPLDVVTFSTCSSSWRKRIFLIRKKKRYFSWLRKKLSMNLRFKRSMRRTIFKKLRRFRRCNVKKKFFRSILRGRRNSFFILYNFRLFIKTITKCRRTVFMSDSRLRFLLSSLYF